MRSGSATLACGQISATHLLKQSGEIPAIQELLNHSDVKSAKFYTHWLNRDPSGLRSPAELPYGSRISCRPRINP